MWNYYHVVKSLETTNLASQTRIVSMMKCLLNFKKSVLKLQDTMFKSRVMKAICTYTLNHTLFGLMCIIANVRWTEVYVRKFLRFLYNASLHTFYVTAFVYSTKCATIIYLTELLESNKTTFPCSVETVRSNGEVLLFVQDYVLLRLRDMSLEFTTLILSVLEFVTWHRTKRFMEVGVWCILLKYVKDNTWQHNNNECFRIKVQSMKLRLSIQLWKKLFCYT